MCGIWMRVLVVYGTRWGGTREVAERIGDTLRGDKHLVEVVEAKTDPQVNGFDLVIIGSGIRADSWTKSALSFLEKNAKLLRCKKTALFVSCQMADRENEARDKAKQKYLLEISEKFGLKPISHGFFGGFLDFSKSHGLLVDIIVRVNRRNLKKNGLDTSKIYDTRDWIKIAAWTHEVVALAPESREYSA